MPAYDYRCPECGFMDEVTHGMTEKPIYDCPDCDVEMKRVFSVPHLGHGKTIEQKRFSDRSAQESDMKQEMSEDYGVESFVPFGKNGVSDVYSDIKGNGSFVKERMQAESEVSEKKQKVKKREWMKQALKRAPKRSREKKERKAAEDAKNRAVRLSSRP